MHRSTAVLLGPFLFAVTACVSVAAPAHLVADLDCTSVRFATEREQLQQRVAASLGGAVSQSICLYVESLPERAPYRKLALVSMKVSTDRQLEFYGLQADGAWRDISDSGYLVSYDPTVDKVQLGPPGPDGVPNIHVQHKHVERVLWFDASTGNYAHLPTYEMRHPSSQ